MQWALIATKEMQMPSSNSDGNMIMITVEPGTIINIIVYNGTDSYTPPNNIKLEQVPNTAKIGDTGY